MPDKPRKQIVLLSLLLVGLAAVLVWQFWPGEASSPAGAPVARTPASAARNRQASGRTAVAPPPHVNLDALDSRGPDPALAARNPFRMQAAVPPPAVTPSAPPSTPGGTGPGAGPMAPEAPPPPPPIALKFIGTVAPSATPSGKIAVLSDGKYVYYGREGDIIEGRYRLVKIGEESLQIEYVDGRGRQTLRLSGA
jgi:hypothetical protein